MIRRGHQRSAIPRFSELLRSLLLVNMCGRIICVNLSQVLLVDVKLRLLNAVSILWQSVVSSLEHYTIGLVSRPGCQKPAVNVNVNG